MLDQLKILYQLQQLERQKVQLTAQKTGVNADEARQIWHEIKLISQNVTADRDKLVCLEKVCSRQETDLLASTKQCEQMEAKLYGGEITNLKEMEQVKEKCEIARKSISNLEEEVYNNLDYYEKLTAKIAQEEIDLQTKKRHHAEKQQKINLEIANLDKKLAELEEQRITLANQVNKELMDKYKALSRKLPLPVAKVENGICGGCRRSIPTSQETLIRTSLSYCDNCGRMLIVE